MTRAPSLRVRAGGCALLAAAALSEGCATVRPWERGVLAHECMQLPVDPWEAAYHGHFRAVREGSAGGMLSGGGGCGCN